MIDSERITSPSDPSLTRLCEELRSSANALATPAAWPAQQLRACAERGVFEWFVPRTQGGQGWSEADIIRGYLQLSAACLTTTFVITQLTGACRRLVASENLELQQQLLPDWTTGQSFATVGISHLTTSRQHVRKPVLRASLAEPKGLVLNGLSPWVTGARYADYVVTGATLEDGRQLLAVVSTTSPGVTVRPAAELVALTASQTGAVEFQDVTLPTRWLLAGPVQDVMQKGVGGRAGGLQTSTLALGLSRAALDFMVTENPRRPELTAPTEQMETEWVEARDQLLSLADAEPDASTAGELRVRSNSLVLRATQAALIAAKGAGYIQGHPAGRWCREALFFLVWSCPQPVAAANLCEFAGIA